MYSNREIRKGYRYAVCTAIAVALTAGYVSDVPFAKANSGSGASEVIVYSQEKDLAKAEKAVVGQPGDASLRAALARAYLGAGRFESAVETFRDAIALGDQSSSTALSLAIAYVGTGRNADALTLLNQRRDSLPASDYGLAIALAGDTGRGVAVLSDELRGGNSDVKLRQNLAYAFALDGRWLEARLMAAQDVGADQLDERISDWAAQARPEDYRQRVASLLGVPVRSDQGQPEFLALSNSGDEAPTALALADSEAVDSANGELPAVESGESNWSVDDSQSSGLYAADDPSSSRQFDEAFAVSDSSSRFVSRPVVQSIPSSSEPATRKSWHPSPTGRSTHLVQLGSFSSPGNAERAWKIYQNRYPTLRDHDLRITEAVVNGKNFWRVAAAGYDYSSARSMCSSVKMSGFGCIAHAEARPLPGALPQGSGSGPMRARRR